MNHFTDGITIHLTWPEAVNLYDVLRRLPDEFMTEEVANLCFAINCPVDTRPAYAERLLSERLQAKEPPR